MFVVGSFDHSMKWMNRGWRLPSSLLSLPFLLTFLARLYKAFWLAKQQNKNKNIQFVWSRLWSSLLDKSDWALSPPLKYPSSIFIWRRGSSRNVSSFHWQFFQKLVLFFRRFEENRHGQIRNGESNCIFTNDIWPKPATGCEPNMVSQNIYKWALFHTCRPFHWLKRRHVWKSAHL